MALRPQYALNKVTKALGITALDQWYHVSHHALSKLIGPRAFNNYGGIEGFLKSAYPHHHFDEEKLATRNNLERDQKFIEVVIRKLFPNAEIQTKARKAVGIINPKTEAYLEIDFWIPSLKLGIEYQDKHHYSYQWYANESLEDYQKRDNFKKDAMNSLGYTLITIGHWWDKTLESVAATIRKFRPDLLQEYTNASTEPIPPDPPSDVSSTVIPGVVDIMSPFVPGINFNPVNWFAGEKYDGIRGVYNPALTKLFSRAGKELSVLPSLVKDIPNILVEGEITAGRGNYTKTAAVSYHSYHEKVNWPMFRYVLFDIPDNDAGNYTERFSTICSALSSRPFIFSQSPFRVLVTSKDQLKMLVDATISDAGEGMIIQKDAQYEYGRAKSLAKIKVRRDADAQVLRVKRLSCLCKLDNGSTADIIFCDDFDPSQLKPGDVVSYYHNGYTKSGKPNQGEIYKVRYDTTWEKLMSDKVQNTVQRRSGKEAMGGTSLNARNTVRNKMGHWNKAPNVRAFFNEFALTTGFDPLVAANWFPVTVTALINAGGTGLLRVYSFSIQKALLCAYPELEFDAEQFKTRGTCDLLLTRLTNMLSSKKGTLEQSN